MTPSGPHPAALPPDALLAQCDVRHKKGSGPGGQHRNKVETGVALAHRPTGLRAEATERRDRPANERAALFRLRVQLALRVRRPPAAAPSPLWTKRARGGQLRVRATHDDFPALLAEALDVLHARDLDPRAAAEHLGVSPSQLLKLIKLEPRALSAWNVARVAKGEHRLR